MKMLKKLLYLLLALPVIASCTNYLDPFLGGQGASVNINGGRYVMLEREDPAIISFLQGEENYSAYINLPLFHKADLSFCLIELYLQSPEEFVCGKPYAVTAQSRVNKDYPLSGEVTFSLLEGGVCEASFQLDAGVVPAYGAMAFRHGFIRYNYSTQQ